ncbi:hypothetical protein P4573_14280 [Priestia megaterium]|uniref:hypothetical protein n=1 Tax=Priestia megaterium TaxID=1404 RepID=UPI002E2440E8|nr:hypothetical protein [Priestia megaterium]
MPKGKAGGGTGGSTGGSTAPVGNTPKTPGQLFVNTVSLGTIVTVTLSNGTFIVKAKFLGTVDGLINLGGFFVNPNDIVGFSV